MNLRSIFLVEFLRKLLYLCILKSIVVLRELMKITYPIKIQYKDGVITSLFSPHLRVNFISQYIELTNILNNEKIPPNILLKVECLQTVVDNYIIWVQANNYKFRHPDFVQANLIHENDQWVNIQINTQLKKGLSEKTAQVVSVSIFFVSYSLAEGFFALAARMDKISYENLLLPMVVDFSMSTIIYYYSGAASNIISKGKELDDWLYNRAVSPLEEAESRATYSLLSTWNLSRALLCILAISKTIFDNYSFWQSIMAMKKQFEQSNVDDPILTPTFIYNLAVITIVINAFYETAKLSSFALKATGTLEILFDKCVNAYRKGITLIRGEGYFEVLTNEEPIENEFSRTQLIELEQYRISSSANVKQEEKDKKTVHNVFFITNVVYDNLLLNKEGLLREAWQIGGIEGVQTIINLGKSREIADVVIDDIEKYGVKHAVNLVLVNITKHSSIGIESTIDKFLSIADKIQQNPKTYSNNKISISDNINLAQYFAAIPTENFSHALVSADSPKNSMKTIFENDGLVGLQNLPGIVEHFEDFLLILKTIIEQNFFLKNKKGRDFIQDVSKILDIKDLCIILELGTDSDIAEQILSEIELQGTNMVIATLLGKEVLTAGTTNLENIIGTQELNHLRMISNGIFNPWSSKAYHKIIEYIDNLAKNLDDLLNTGRSGNQIAVTVALLEEWLGFAASGQRFIGRPSYYNSDDNNDWSYGSGDSSDGNNNSSAKNFDNQNEFVGLILSPYNGTDIQFYI